MSWPAPSATRVERQGTEVIEEHDRKGSPAALFWPWSAATISVLAVSYGAFALAFGISWIQAVLVAAASIVLSAALCGVIAVAGKRGSAPTLVLSRAAFGVIGNRLPAAVSWLLSVGWEIVATATATLAAATVFRHLGWGGGSGTQAVALTAVLVLIVGSGVLGFDAVIRIQYWIMRIGIVPMAVYLALTFSHIDFRALGDAPDGDPPALVGAFVFLVAGGGLGWANTAADYSRYLPRSSSSAGVVAWTTIGLSAAPLVLIEFGILLTASDGALRTAIFADPVGALASLLPTWFLIPFALISILGLVGTAVLEIYSSGLSLLSMGVPLPRAIAVALDGLVMTVAVVYVVFFAPGDFFTQFQGFVITLGVPISAWAGIMLADVLLRKADYDEGGLFDRSGRYRAYQWPTIAVFLVASFVGFGLVIDISAGWLGWQGYLLAVAGGREGPWAEADLGVIAALLLGFVGYVLARRRAVATQDE